MYVCGGGGDVSCRDRNFESVVTHSVRIPPRHCSSKMLSTSLAVYVA